MIKKYVFFNKYDTLLLMTGSISMNSELNTIDNVVNNRVSYLYRKYRFLISIYPIIMNPYSTYKMCKYRSKTWDLISKSLKIIINLFFWLFSLSFILKWSISLDLIIKILIQILGMKNERSLYDIQHYDIMFCTLSLQYDTQRKVN